ncbi:hypothetical protein AMECASPLE_032629 [Ameca splendens]|uniref:Uncharacterized protein n=1 Tax=Ameca splendens TaxID=208324 RepID=A0ABV0ZFF0_9TELE
MNGEVDIKGEITRYKAGLASVPVAGFMVTYNKHNLRLEDLGTLEDQNWLNDQIINMYGELIMDVAEHKVCLCVYRPGQHTFQLRSEVYMHLNSQIVFEPLLLGD